MELLEFTIKSSSPLALFHFEMKLTCPANYFIIKIVINVYIIFFIKSNVNLESNSFNVLSLDI